MPSDNHTQCEKSIEVISHKFVTHFSTNQMQLVLYLQHIELIQLTSFDQEVQNRLNLKIEFIFHQ